MRIIKGTLFLLLMVITLSSCSVETKPDNNIVLNSKQIENSNPIFEFLNTVETKRFISEIQTNPLAYAEITFTDKDKGEIFRTAISNNTEIINVYKALSEILVADEESEEDIYSGVSYTWFFDIRQGYPYEITIYENCIMHNGKYYSLYNTNYFINLTRLHINNDRPSPNQKYKVGDKIDFGVYEQDNNISNGMEPLKWRILDIKDDKMLILTDLCIEKRVFHSVEGKATWANSDMRKWLNSDFINTAFSEVERSTILESNIKNSKGSLHKYDDMEDTIDRVFLLSEGELYKYFDDTYDNGFYPDRQAGYTDTIRNLLNKWGPYEDEYISWWLRTQGNTIGEIMDSSTSGVFDADIWTLGVRPAMWVSLL